MDDLRKHIQKKLENPDFAIAWEDSEPAYEIARQIIALRLKKGWTQKDLAKKIGTTQSVIARIENGGQNISVRTLTRLARALDAEVRIELLAK